MSTDDVNHATGELAIADRNLDKAQQATAAVRQAVDEQKTIIGRQYPAIAANLARVDPHLDTIDRMLDDARTRSTSAAGQVASVPDRPAPDQIIAALTPASDTCDRLATLLNDAAAEIGAAIAVINAALSGGSPGTLTGKARRITSFNKGAYRNAVAARQATDRALTQARTIGETPGTATPAPNLAPPGGLIAGTGTPTPAPSERPGERVAVEEPDYMSRAASWRKKAVKKAPDVRNLVTDTASSVRQSVGLARPTGQHTTIPRGHYYAPEPTPPHSGDIVTGVLATAAVSLFHPAVGSWS